MRTRQPKNHARDKSAEDRLEHADRLRIKDFFTDTDSLHVSRKWLFYSTLLLSILLVLLFIAYAV